MILFDLPDAWIRSFLIWSIGMELYNNKGIQRIMKTGYHVACFYNCLGILYMLVAGWIYGG